MKKFFKKFHPKQTGFTLIELLVVIAIIGILAAIIVPNVSKYISSGSDAAKAAETNIVQNAVSAAMASAKVPSCTVSGGTAPIKGTGVLATSIDFDVTSGYIAAVATPLKTQVGYYLTGGVQNLKGTYTVVADGTVTCTGYTP